MREFIVRVVTTTKSSVMLAPLVILSRVRLIPSSSVKKFSSALFVLSQLVGKSSCVVIDGFIPKIFNLGRIEIVGLTPFARNAVVLFYGSDSMCSCAY